jgi:hypothetical protein
MLPRADITTTRPLAYVEAPTPVGGGTDARQEVYHRLTQIAIGQTLEAEVLKRLDDGTFVVRLADTSARMSLPAGTQPGDKLNLTLLEHEPRLAFTLDQTSAKTGDARATLSTAGKMIDQLLQSAQQGGASTAVIGKVPVMRAPGGDPNQVAAALQDAVDQSGLFYESHLAQWAEGSRSLAEVMREPQAKIASPPNIALKPGGSTDSVLLRHLIQQWNASGRSLPDLVRELQTRTGNFLRPDAAALSQPQAAANYLNNLVEQWTGSGRSMQDLMPPNADQSTAQPINQHAAQLVNSQLHALEHQRFVWQGELWPGQKMEWEVSRDAPQGRSDDSQQQSWQSAVRFELPTLGTITATVHLSGQRVNVFVKTATDEAAATLRAHGGELAQALQAAGSPLDSLIVNRDGQA